MGQVRWTEEASSCLEGIFEYIARENADAARRVVRGIYEKAQSLRRLPRRGHQYTTRRGRSFLLVHYGHYRIVYHMLTGEVVEILGVYHDAMDLDRRLDADA